MPSAPQLKVVRKLTILTAAVSPAALAFGSGGTAMAAPAGPDVIAPRSHPVAGHVRAYVRPGSRTTRVSFSIDGRRVDVDRRAPFRYGKRGLLNTRKLRNGRHRLTIRVRDQGKTHTVRRTLRVRNRGARSSARRSSPPTVAWRAPGNTATVSGVLRGTACEVMAWDDRRVRRVRFYVDGKRVGTARYAPYICAIDTTKLSDGPHSLRAIAVDSSRKRTELTRRINVRNARQAAPDAAGTAAGRSETPSGASWADEFNGAAGSSPDRSKWAFDTGGSWQNGTELQQYTDRPENVAHDGNGNLAITTRRETYSGSDGVSRDYTSARIKTQGKFSFRYGRVEARMKIPVRKGLLPAFWTLGTDIDSVGWPESGEIDLMEVPGSDQYGEAGSVQYHLHGPGADPGAMVRPSDDIHQNWHTYGMIWTPDAVKFTFDGQVRSTMTKEQLGGAWRAFQKDHFLIFNTAVGNSWTGAPDGSTPFPATMLIDWVRYFPGG